MLSGNGRHRRPRQAPAIVVAAGVTGSAIALPLLGAANAHAADGATWDRLAECESGGSWNSVPGNGHYGGLQLTAEEWLVYGGLEYALSPDRATKPEQIAVAEALLADQGPDAWPGCADVIGLTPSESPAPSDSADPDDSDPDDSDSDDSDSASPSSSASSGAGSASGSDSSGSGSGSGSGSSVSKSPEPSASDAGKGHADQGGADKSDKPGSAGSPSAGSPSADSSSADDGSGRHRGDRADEESGQGGPDRSEGRHASRDGEEGEREDEAYTVRPGDSLWAISEAHDFDGGWPALYAANKETVGDDPDLILPGQLLDLSGL